MTSVKIGTTLATLTALSDLTVFVPEPRLTFVPYAETVTATDGREIGIGWSRNVWEFGYLTDAQRNALRVYCPNVSSEAYIETYNDSLATPSWRKYRAIMVWTHAGEERRNGKRLQLTITFKLIEDVT